MSPYICCLCRKAAYGYGNNPEPLADFSAGRCCDECNQKVTKQRFYDLFKRVGVPEKSS